VAVLTGDAHAVVLGEWAIARVAGEALARQSAPDRIRVASAARCKDMPSGEREVRAIVVEAHEPPAIRPMTVLAGRPVRGAMGIAVARHARRVRDRPHPPVVTRQAGDAAVPALEREVGRRVIERAHVAKARRPMTPVAAAAELRTMHRGDVARGARRRRWYAGERQPVRAVTSGAWTRGMRAGERELRLSLVVEARRCSEPGRRVAAFAPHTEPTAMPAIGMTRRARRRNSDEDRVRVAAAARHSAMLARERVLHVGQGVDRARPPAVTRVTLGACACAELIAVRRRVARRARDRAWRHRRELAVAGLAGGRCVRRVEGKPRRRVRELRGREAAGRVAAFARPEVTVGRDRVARGAPLVGDAKRPGDGMAAVAADPTVLARDRELRGSAIVVEARRLPRARRVTAGAPSEWFVTALLLVTARADERCVLELEICMTCHARRRLMLSRQHARAERVIELELLPRRHRMTALARPGRASMTAVVARRARDRRNKPAAAPVAVDAARACMPAGHRRPVFVGSQHRWTKRSCRMAPNAVRAEGAAMWVCVTTDARSRHTDVVLARMTAHARDVTMLAVERKPGLRMIERGRHHRLERMVATTMIDMTRGAPGDPGAVKSRARTHLIRDVGVTRETLVVGNPAERDVARVAARLERGMCSRQRARRNKPIFGVRVRGDHECEQDEEHRAAHRA
jgi:hypothetical protein